MTALAVTIDDVRVGTLHEHGGGLRFEYEAAWIERSEGFAISRSNV